MDSHDTLLIACKTAENRAHLRSVLEERFNLLEAANARQMMVLLKQNMDCIATVILDSTRKGCIDESVFSDAESRKLLDMLPVIAIIEDESPRYLHEAFSRGCIDAVPFDYEPNAMLHRIENIVQLHIHKQHLETIVQQQAMQLLHTKETMIDALSAMIEYRSVESGQHILRIRQFTRILLEEVAKSCPEYGLGDAAIAIISSASALHDIGKIAIPDSVLMKPGPLTAQERELMNTHTVTGCHIIDSLNNMGDREYLRYAHNICHYHHERWDGKGYPEGLAGDDIPICAQVVGLADAFDALTSKRVYKEAYPYSKAVNMILKGECGAFSPKLLECFKHVAEPFRQLAMDYSDGLPSNRESFDTSLPKPLPLQGVSMERTRAKYNALVHYINGLLIEIDAAKGLMHLIYNPYPEFSWLEGFSSLQELSDHLVDAVVSQEQRSDFVRFLRDDLKLFLDQDLRRMTRFFRFVHSACPEGELFELSLLRIQPLEPSSRSMAVLCKKVQDKARAGDAPGASYILSDSSITCRNDSRFTLLEIGRGIQELAGYSREEISRCFHDSLLELVLPQDRDAMRRAFQEQLTRGALVETEFRVRHKNGSVIWVLDKSYLSVGPDGQEIFNSFLTDITHTKRAYEQLSRKLERYEIILAQTENVLFEWEIASDRLTVSDTWETIFGFRLEAVQLLHGLEFNSHLHPDDIPSFYERLRSIEQGSDYEMFELRIATAGGRYLWCRIRASALRDARGELEKIVGIIINIDTEKKEEQLLQKRAERDSLTRLFNKAAGQKYAEEYLSRGPKENGCALLVIDVDNFKNINDRYGHLFGDMVLSKAAREIERTFRPQDIVSRIGGDEFAVLIKGVSDRKLLEARCTKLLERLGSAFRSKELKPPLSCSIGIALTNAGGCSYLDLFRCADQALYMAKARGKNGFCFYEGHALQGEEALPLSPITPIDPAGEWEDAGM